MQGRRLRSGAILGAALAILSWLVLSATLPLPASGRRAVADRVRELELKLHDARLRWLGLDRTCGDEVALAVVNQADLDYVEDQLGEGWPWPREFWALLTDYLTDIGVSAIGFDLYFTEPSRYPEDDATFGESIANSGRVVLALGTSSRPDPTHPEAGAIPQALRRAVSLEASGAPSPVPSRFRIVPPVDPIATGATAAGIAELATDPDGLVRRMPPVFSVGDTLVPSFSMRLAMAQRGADRLAFDPGLLRFQEATLPLAREGCLTVRFLRPDPPRTPAGFTFPAVHVADLLQAAIAWTGEGDPPEGFDPSRLAGKVVVVGINVPGQEDEVQVPLAPNFPGPELQATAVETLLQAWPLDEWPGEGPWEAAPAALLALLVCIGATMPQRFWVSAAAAAGLLLLWVATSALAYRAGVLVPLFGPIAASGAAFASSNALLYLTEGRRKREIQKMFSQYMAPAVIEELQRHPEKLQLGGERKTMTVFFSDIEGFTTISESMDPEELVAFLNDYLTRCTDVLLESGGVIDKYEGDAIIAFWNAPLDVEGHPRRACEAALACQEACAAFREEMEAKGLPPVRMRVGLNTGPMVVGNLGSSRRFDFTVIGDAVNLAARLEGANKAFGTYTMVSDATRKASGQGVAFRELGRLRVKGKTIPIPVHEILGRGSPPAWATRFEAALADFYDRRFDDAEAGFRGVLEERPEDPPARRYLERIEELRREPPGEEFDGVWTLQTK